jgi:nitrite reductase/ring-hydroxylating ferredoxin subunit
MAAEQSKPKGPDFTRGVALDHLGDGGMVGGHVGEEAVLLARRGDEFLAIGATCSHYGGPLGEGLIVGDTVRCPWHHACFSLRTGEAVAAPAFNPMPCWRVEKRNGMLFVREKIEPADRRATGAGKGPSAKTERMVIVGGGAAGFAAAEMLRRQGFAGAVTLLSADDAAPYDRPNCSKDYLAGNAPEEWMPLRPREFYQDQSIELELRTEVAAIDASARKVTLADGRSMPFDKLLSQPAPNRFASTSPVPMHRTFSCCARSRIRGRSSPRRKPRGARSCSAQALSDWRSLPRYGRVTSRCTWWRRSAGRWNACWGANSAMSSAPFTSSRASYSISRRPQPQSMPQASTSRAAPHCRPTSWSSALACDRERNWPRAPG